MCGGQRWRHWWWWAKQLPILVFFALWSSVGANGRQCYYEVASLFHHGAPPPPLAAAHNKHALCLREGREPGGGIFCLGVSGQEASRSACFCLDNRVRAGGKTRELQVRLCAMAAAASTSSTTWAMHKRLLGPWIACADLGLGRRGAEQPFEGSKFASVIGGKSQQW